MPTNTTSLSQQYSKPLLLPALRQDGRVFIDADDLHGYAEELEEDTIIFYAAYKDGSHRAGADVWDLIRLTSAETRFRTWQIQAGGNVVRLCEVAETKSSSRNAFIPGMHSGRFLADRFPSLPAPPAKRGHTDTIADFPILAKHIGTWEGTFTFINPEVTREQ